MTGVVGDIVGLWARLLEAPLERGRRDAQPGARDAIVVFGAPLRDDALTSVLRERIAAATALWQRGAGRWVVATGGVTQGARRAEADAIADGLRAAGVAGDAIVVEPDSQSTAENAARTAALLRARGARSAWVISQPFHVRRAAHLLARAGIDAAPWWIRDSLQYRDRRRLRWLVREYAAWARLLVAPCR